MANINKKFVVAIMVVFVIILTYFLFVKDDSNKNVGKSIGSLSEEENQDAGQDVFNENDEPIDESTLAIGGFGGSGRDSGGGEYSSEGSSCPTQQISYSIQKIVKNIICLQESGGNCLEQQISCSAEIHNLDDETAGNFKTEIKFIEKSQEFRQINSKVEEFSLPPGEFRVVQGTASLQGQDLELDCFFNTLEVPEKEICP
ncbi:hypothetical protein HYT23_03650 [Candidatus Pacearchaeota archaeon]|nr:hypothetical protein [Candidatus Pacearchaeota archaeon]